MNPFRYGKEVSGHQFYDRTESWLVEALAVEPVARLDERYRTRHRLASLSTLHSAIRGLLRRGVIDVIKGTYVMADPFFARYVRER